jgi:arginyl-tRNA--protein-N-Asp/Glu arginylyltransferase
MRPDNPYEKAGDMGIGYNKRVGITMKKLTIRDPRFVFSEDVPCPYIDDGRTASLEFILPAEGIARHFHEFLAAGYRRLGNVLYHNVCRTCSSCRPIRLETEKFKASKSQRRTLRKNRDVTVECRVPSVTPVKLELYKNYVMSKHSQEADSDIRDYRTTLSGLHQGYAGSIEMDYFLGGRLIAAGIVDEGEDALSSAYFYYDTAHLDRRLGIYSILHEISLALSLGKRYYYLGFCVEETPKMSYKKFFLPSQIYEDGVWKNYLLPE